MGWFVWIDAPFVRLGNFYSQNNSHITVERICEYNFFTLSMLYPMFQGEIQDVIYPNIHQKKFDKKEEAEEFFNFLKVQLPPVYDDFHELDKKIKELEKLKKTKLSGDIKIVFEERWKNETRFNKLREVLE